jgi:hypothetical protein
MSFNSSPENSQTADSAGPAHRLVGHYAIYRRADASLHLGWNSGFFSNNTTALWSICDLLKQGLPVEKVEYRFCFSAYRSLAQPIYEYDLYPDYFTPDFTIDLPDPAFLSRVNHHGYYHDLEFGWLTPLLKRYFTPSERVRQILSQWREKYHFDPTRTIGVCYRGTDKGTEVRLAQPRKYLELARQLLQRHPDHRILIQTDQAQVRDLFVREFGSACWYLDEMPVTQGDDSLAHLSTAERGVDCYEFGLRILATTLLLSECDQLINHTGNLGLWIALFRGHHQGAWQFGATGKLCTEARRRWGERRRAWLQFLRDCRRPHLLLRRWKASRMSRSSKPNTPTLLPGHSGCQPGMAGS